MLQINQSQMNAFSHAQQVRFEKDAIEFLKNHFPDAAKVPEEELQVPIREQVDKARSYGFEIRRNLLTYIKTAWIFGSSFDMEFPVVTEVLEHPKMPILEKAQFLEDFTIEMFKALTEEG